MSSVRIVISVVSILLGVGFGYWISQSNSTPDIETAMVYPQPVQLSDLSLIDSEGRAIDAGFFTGDWQLVFFGFTYCPDICPLTLQTLATARSALTDIDGLVLPTIVLVSVDPDRDTPEKLAEYISYFGDGVRGITGELDEIRKLTDGLGIFFQKVELEQGGYTVDHSSVVLVIDPKGRLVALFSAPHSAESIANDMHAMIAS